MSSSSAPPSPSPSTPTRHLASALTTPEQTKKRAPSTPPLAPVKKKMNMNENIAPTEDPLLLISIEEGKIVTYSSNHPCLSGIKGYYSDILEFYSDELFAHVLSIVGAKGYRGKCSSEEVLAHMKASLVRLFSEEAYGGGEAVNGQVCRGTIVI